MTQEQYADLKSYLPESETVKMVFADMHPELNLDDNWDASVFTLVDRALNGDKDALMNLLELTFMSGMNEGELNMMAMEKGELDEEGHY
jgi:hypothetical protein